MCVKNSLDRLCFDFGAVAILWREIVEPSLRVDFPSARLNGSWNARDKDDLIVFNKKKFGDYVKEIYPSQLTVEKDLANYLDLTFVKGNNNRLYTKLYDKCDDFDFRIVNFPFLSSNIPSSPSYGVYIS